MTINGNDNFKGASDKSGDGLHTFVRKMEGTWGDRGGQWPTPNARDWKDTGATQGNRHSPNLGTAVHTHTQQPSCLKFPTPQAHDATAGTTRPHGWATTGQKAQRNLNDLVLYPTPRVHDATHDGPSELARHAPNLATLARLENR